MNIGLCFIATGKYSVYLPPIVEQAQRLFLADHDLTIFTFGDKDHGFQGNVIHAHLDHIDWPFPTLYRYHFMLGQPRLRDMDYVYYLDVDMEIMRPVGDEILGDLVATIHPGYCEAPRSHFTYEPRKRSRAYIPPDQGIRYYAGAFQGGKAPIYLEAMREMASRIDEDMENHIVAQWHDESHWNRYCIDHPPTVELPHEYCCPAQWRRDTQVICIRGKDNNYMRS